MRAAWHETTRRGRSSNVANPTVPPTPRGLFRDETPVPGFQHQYNRPEAHAEPMRDRFALDIGSENRAASTILLLEWV